MINYQSFRTLLIFPGSYDIIERKGGRIMEAVAVIAVVSVVLLIIGFKPFTIISLALLLLTICFALMALFFVFFFARMLFTRVKKAEFLRIGRSPRNRFNVAYYSIDGKEYPNIFPSEGIRENKLYKEGKKYTVLLSRNNKFVFDRFSIATCTIGFLFCTGVSLLLTFIIKL